MNDITASVLLRLDANRLALDLGPAVYFPAYDGLSIANLPASILAWLGCEPLAGMAPPLDAQIRGALPGPFRHVVLLLVDGLGLDLLQDALAHSDEAPLAPWTGLPADAQLAALTSIVPSTTAAALVSLWTGTYPGAHGVVGYTQYLKEYGLIANMILHNPATYAGEPGSLRQAGFNPETFLSVPTLSRHLAAQGVHVLAGQHRSIARSGLSTMLFPGASVAPLYDLGDLFVTLAESLEERPTGRTYTYLYWSELDDLSHRYGPGSARYQRGLYDFSLQFGLFLRERLARRRGDTLFLLTADHGHVATPHDPQLELRRHPALLDCLALLPSGEARLPYLALRPGREAECLEYVARAWPGRFRPLRVEAAIQAGLYAPQGWPLLPNLADRLGDWILVPQSHQDYLWFDLLRDNPLRGRHGGLSREEMLVPLLSIVL